MSQHSTGDPIGEPYASTVSRKFALVVLAGLTAAFLISVLLKPATGEYFTICGFKNFTGLPCPGCGLTHSFCALAKGNIGEAFEFNLLGPPLYAALVLVWVRSVGVLFNREKATRVIDEITERFKLVRAFAYAFAIYGSARIIYLLVFQPLPFHESALSKLLARLVH